MSIKIWPKRGIVPNGVPLYDTIAGETEVDIRSEMNTFLAGDANSPQRGHWVLLRRMDKAQRCSCWNKRGSGNKKYSDDFRKYDEPDENCTICGGSGWVYEDELYLVRRRMVAPAIGLAEEKEKTPVGIMSVLAIVYYFEYYVNPKKEDKIIEITNDADGNPVRPYEHQEMHNVSVAEPLRDKKGRIEYWRVAVKMEVL